jgi:quercetin dioxygenase-like cupin family protein
VTDEEGPVPAWHRVLLENPRVRVLEARIPPHAISALHHHPPNVVFQVSDARAVVRFPEGTPQPADLHAGDTLWSDGGPHEVENVGDTELVRIVVELKR